MHEKMDSKTVSEVALAMECCRENMKYNLDVMEQKICKLIEKDASRVIKLDLSRPRERSSTKKHNRDDLDKPFHKYSFEKLNDDSSAPLAEKLERYSLKELKLKKSAVLGKDIDMKENDDSRAPSADKELNLPGELKKSPISDKDLDMEEMNSILSVWNQYYVSLTTETGFTCKYKLIDILVRTEWKSNSAESYMDYLQRNIVTVVIKSVLKHLSDKVFGDIKLIAKWMRDPGTLDVIYGTLRRMFGKDMYYNGDEEKLVIYLSQDVLDTLKITTDILYD